MINVHYDSSRNILTIEFKGKVTASEGEAYLPQVQKALQKSVKGFACLVDLSTVEEIDRKIKPSISKAMDLINAHGVAKIARVIPSPTIDIGFNIMTLFHYAETVQVATVPTRKEAEERLGKK